MPSTVYLAQYQQNVQILVCMIVAVFAAGFGPVYLAAIIETNHFGYQEGVLHFAYVNSELCVNFISGL